MVANPKSMNAASEAPTKQASAKLEAEKVSNEKAVTEKIAAEQTSELEPTLQGTVHRIQPMTIHSPRSH